MADLPVKDTPKDTKIEIEQGNVGVLQVKLLADILNTLKRIEVALDKKRK